MDIKELYSTANMARLTISEKEAEKLNTAVSQMLDYFAIMQNVDTEKLEPTTHALLSKNRVRSDENIKFEDSNLLLKNAPELEDKLIVIPNVL
jgi:aspartyl-tRNA(Asn)/glutamyl-tRNA(Gln) amidotransferase subunit C